MSNAPQKSYGQILKSSAVIGGSSAITLVLGMVRAKAIALLLGTGGAGVWGMSWSIAELARGIAGMGLNVSGVKQIAQAVGTEDNQRIARTVVTLRRISLVLGLGGALLLGALCVPVGRLSFDDDKHTWAVAVLSLTVLFSIVSQGQSALIQGMRRIGDLARINIFGAVVGTLICIPIVCWLGEQGIAPALVGVSLALMVASWWFARQIKVEPVNMTAREICGETSGLLKLGFVFMVSGLMLLGVNYLVNLILMQRIDKHAVGLYQAAWLIGGYFANFILQAMGTDFFPRLAAVVKDNARCNQLVNEQSEVSLLLAGPGLVATLTFAPLAIHVLQSSEFLPAVDVLRLFSLGMLLRVLSWPMAFIMQAKNALRVFFVSELLSNLVYITIVWFAVDAWGVKGVGVAFIGLYALYTAAAYGIARNLTGFRWSWETMWIAFIYMSLALGVFAAFQFLSATVATVIGSLVMVGMGVYSTRKICRLVPPERFPRRVRQLLIYLRLLPRMN
ncbi:MAG TPA: O-antigen translocase [Verrucomicrobiae bacterium]|nr:O-antigen translocase [Verrucomicrobiae bacterium]